MAMLATCAEMKLVFDPSSGRVGEGVLWGPTNDISITSAEIVFLKVTRNVPLCLVRRRFEVRDGVLTADLL